MGFVGAVAPAPFGSKMSHEAQKVSQQVRKIEPSGTLFFL